MSMKTRTAKMQQKLEREGCEFVKREDKYYCVFDGLWISTGRHLCECVTLAAEALGETQKA